jgi:ABC-type bacteriocin/lantibiotic exporter with double-glycine peptidase domain
MDGDHIYVIDPASGRRKLPVETVERMFTGVALEFETPATDVNRPIAETCTVRDPNPWLQLKRFVSFDRTWISLFASSVLILVFTFIAPLGTAYFVDTLSRSSAPLDGWATVAAILGLGALYFFLQLTRGLAVLRLQTLADRTVTLGALRHLLSLPLPFFTRRTAGDLALRVRTSTVVRQVLTTSVFTALFDGILLLTYLALLLLADLQIAALVLVLAAIQVGLLVKAWRRQTYLTADALESQAQADSELHEILEGVATVKSNGLEGHAGESWSNTLAEEINARTRSRSHLAVFSAASSSVQLSAPLLVLCLAASRVTDGALSIGSAVGYVALSIGVFAPLANLVQSGLQVAGLRASLSRLSDIFDTEPESRGADVTKTKVPSGVIELKDVHFSYPGGPEVLKSISLSIPEGSFCAIVGKSGCGKSTLAALLAGLLHPTVGDVSASSAVVRADGSVSLREFASFFNQDVRLSAGSIRDNISMGLPIADEGRIIAAAKSAHVHDEIMNLPMKYETLIGSGGAGLSGGQRQRVALARVLAAGPSLLILDEATSALDRVTEAAVLASIRGRGGTVVVITHRLSVARDADQVIHIDQGIVVGSGRHSELIASSRLYRELSGEAVNF